MRPLTLLVALASLACGGRADLIGPAGSFDAGLTHDGGATAEASASADADVGPWGGRMTVDVDVTVEVDPTVCHGGDLCFSDAACHGALIRASDYNQSCTTNADCVEVGEGNSCYPCALWCSTTAINGRDLDRYRSDVATALSLSGVEAAIEAGAMIVCHCPADMGACCRAGRCTTGIRCEPCDPGVRCTTDSDCACLDVGRCNDAGHCAEIPVPKCVRGRCEQAGAE
jgi:hypothetical protein